MALWLLNDELNELGVITHCRIKEWSSFRGYLSFIEIKSLQLFTSVYLQFSQCQCITDPVKSIRFSHKTSELEMEHGQFSDRKFMTFSEIISSKA